MKRTATCGELTKKDAGRTVTLNGWVHRNRNHGEIQFINLRDTYGITQVFIGDDVDQELKIIASELKFEYCIAVVGLVKNRPDSMVNPDMTTGEIEIEAQKIEILSRCEVLPFMIDEESDAKEDLRLTYRYLDLRSAGMQKRIKLRTAFTFAVREYLTNQGFMEIETPTLIKSTPEGARDFLVPSRVQAGKFYALPQSPQLFKQILMVSGFDRYFQIARCYRDEDARGDRQLEFTQVDLEMSFVSRDDVLKVTEGLFNYVFEKTMQYELPETFLRLTFDEAMNTYGSDKPDLRFELPMKPFDALAAGSSFNAFTTVLETGGCVKALNAKGCASYSRKQISELEQAAKIYGAKGLAWVKVTEAGMEGGITKFIEDQADEIISYMDAEPGDLLLMVADKWSVCCNSLGAVRSKLGKDLGLIDPAKFVFCWIIDFPLFEYNDNENRWEAAHHMFSMPQAQYLENMEQNPGIVKGDLYDLVLNGYEVASGSIRIHDPEIQKRIFSIVGFSEEEAEDRFGFLLNAFRYGPPPHGGIAPGLDRMVMIMAGQTSIKEVIPFPKNTVGVSPMENSPSIIDEQQLKDLHLKLDLSEDS
ncbi:MAG: aspartate--tRNA ligase [Bacteroidetes bacterium]|nr:aspartate--tRNA ligase [Bacteroidota bacterium]